MTGAEVVHICEFWSSFRKGGVREEMRHITAILHEGPQMPY